MAYADFYNLNANIAYPLVQTSTDTFKFVSGGTLKNSLIVDCGFTLGPRLGYNPAVGAVYLHSVARSGDTLLITFKVDPTGTTITFVRNKTDKFGTTSYSSCGADPTYGVCFLVTGDVASTYDSLYAGETKVLMSYVGPNSVTTYEATVEPSLILSQNKHSALSIKVGNMARLTEGNSNGCGDPPEVDDTVFLQSLGSTVGTLVFRPGYNVAITAGVADNAINVSASVGEGMGESCDNDFIRYEGDIPDQGSRCADFIYTINGIAPTSAGAFIINTGGSFSVEPQGTGWLLITSRLGTQVTCNE